MKHRKRWLAGLVCAALAVAAPAPAAKPGSRPAMSDIEYWSGVFEAPERQVWQKPNMLVRRLALNDGDVVADLGAGTGYFTNILSVEVGRSGKVYAVDVEPAMLEHLKSRQDIIQETMVPVLAEPDDPKLPEGAIDMVLVVNTWHHIKKRRPYMDKLARSLSAEGRVVIVDFYAGELPVGPPPKHKLARAKVVAEFEKAGWTLEAESRWLPYQYHLTFYPPRPPQPILPD